MTEVVVHVAVGDNQAEARFLETLDTFARSRESADDNDAEESFDVPCIMVKTVPGSQITRKAITFQDRRSAAEFLSLWRREQRRI